MLQPYGSWFSFSLASSASGARGVVAGPKNLSCSHSRGLDYLLASREQSRYQREVRAADRFFTHWGSFQSPPSLATAARISNKVETTVVWCEAAAARAKQRIQSSSFIKALRKHVRANDSHASVGFAK